MIEFGENYKKMILQNLFLKFLYKPLIRNEIVRRAPGPVSGFSIQDSERINQEIVLRAPRPVSGVSIQDSNKNQ